MKISQMIKKYKNLIYNKLFHKEEEKVGNFYIRLIWADSSDAKAIYNFLQEIGDKTTYNQIIADIWACENKNEDICYPKDDGKYKEDLYHILKKNLSQEQINWIVQTDKDLNDFYKKHENLVKLNQVT